MLDIWRQKVDEIDNSIIKALEERFTYVRKIGEEKQKIGKNIYDRTREEIVLRKVRDKAESPENAVYLEAVFAAIMETSRMIQSGDRPKRVGFQGTAGSFGEDALRAYFGRSVDASAKGELEEIAMGVASGDLEYGVLPMESSTTGAITAVYDMVSRHGLHIVGEKTIRTTGNSFTRFAVVSGKPEIQEGADKTTIVVSLPHKCGSLYNIISCFQKACVNMLSIESRPVEGSSFEYKFFIDLEGSMEEDRMKSAIAELEESASAIRVLGSYRSDK